MNDGVLATVNELAREGMVASDGECWRAIAPLPRSRRSNFTLYRETSHEPDTKVRRACLVLLQL